MVSENTTTLKTHTRRSTRKQHTEEYLSRQTEVSIRTRLLSEYGHFFTTSNVQNVQKMLWCGRRLQRATSKILGQNVSIRSYFELYREHCHQMNVPRES